MVGGEQRAGVPGPPSGQGGDGAGPAPPTVVPGEGAHQPPGFGSGEGGQLVPCFLAGLVDLIGSAAERRQQDERPGGGGLFTAEGLPGEQPGTPECADVLPVQLGVLQVRGDRVRVGEDRRGGGENRWAERFALLGGVSQHAAGKGVRLRRVRIRVPPGRPACEAVAVRPALLRQIQYGGVGHRVEQRGGARLTGTGLGQQPDVRETQQRQQYLLHDCLGTAGRMEVGDGQDRAPGVGGHRLDQFARCPGGHAQVVGEQPGRAPHTRPRQRCHRVEAPVTALAGPGAAVLDQPRQQMGLPRPFRARHQAQPGSLPVGQPAQQGRGRRFAARARTPQTYARRIRHTALTAAREPARRRGRSAA
ncbi:hypothetical protein [Streptomyces chitinivorans]|uniref:hypothetical protein n=1 Tax=Streptomyces chitinivorans TaxID=1257027 RepID=UPI0031ECB173